MFERPSDKTSAHSIAQEASMMAAFDENLSALSNAVETRLLLLVKIGQIEHLEALRQGRLWARHLEFYKQVEGPPLAHQDSQDFQIYKTSGIRTLRRYPDVL